MLMLQWITRQSYAEDVQDKHGISHISASRLGGAAVFGCTLALIFSALITEVTLLNRGAYGIHWTGWIGALACAVLGLVEDIRNNYLTPFFRLAVMMLIFGMIVGVSPFLVSVLSQNECKKGPLKRTFKTTLKKDPYNSLRFPLECPWISSLGIPLEFPWNSLNISDFTDFCLFSLGYLYFSLGQSYFCP